MQDRELVSAPTNRSARNGQNTKSMNGNNDAATARDWHGAFTPAHGISQNRPKQSGLSIDRIAHSGDKLDRSAGRDAPRFHHECTASTFMTPTHVASMVHMCAAATARASAKAARLYAHERATRHSLRENTLNRPAIIPAPF